MTSAQNITGRGHSCCHPFLKLPSRGRLLKTRSRGPIGFGILEITSRSLEAQEASRAHLAALMWECKVLLRQLKQSLEILHGQAHDGTQIFVLLQTKFNHICSLLDTHIISELSKFCHSRSRSISMFPLKMMSYSFLQTSGKISGQIILTQGDWHLGAEWPNSVNL